MMTGNTDTEGIQQKLDYHELLFFHKITNFIDKMILHCHKSIIMQLIFIDEIVNSNNDECQKVKDTSQTANTTNLSREKQLSEAANKVKSLIDDVIYYEEQEIRELANTLEDVLSLAEKIMRQYYGKDLIGSIDNIHNKVTPINMVISSEFDYLALFIAKNIADEGDIPASVKIKQEMKLFIKYLYSNEKRFIEQTKSTEKELYTIHAILMALKHHFIIAKVPAFGNIEIKVRLSIFEALTKSRQRAYWLMAQKFSLAKLLGKMQAEIVA
jgi:hypothetical protein